ncbi:MAG: GntR family transcriptional regulator [Pseudomonadota bacterium]
MATRVENFRRTGIAQYLTIAETIQGWIAAGRYKQDEPVETVEDLARQFGVAKGTIQEALKELSARGVIETSRGKRSTIRRITQVQPLANDINPANMLLLDAGADVKRELLSARVLSPDAQLRRYLKFEFEGDLLEFRSILHVNGERRIQLLNYVPQARHPLSIDLRGAALDNALIQVVKVSTHAERRVSATLADLEVSKNLSLPMGAPVLRYRSVLWSDEKQLDLYYEMFMRSGEREYVIGG